MTDTIDIAATAMQRPPGLVEWRSAVVADIDERERIIEVRAVPYNEETVVEYPPNSGRTMIEEVLPGAFEGINTRPPEHRVTVNREHDYSKTIGIARALYPDREDGLVADLRISPTPLGDETLALAADGVLGASVGMMVRKSDQRIVGNRRHILRAFLDHIALLANNAYGGAQVLAVREAVAYVEPPATPHLDEWLAYLRDFKMP